MLRLCRLVVVRQEGVTDRLAVRLGDRPEGMRRQEVEPVAMRSLDHRAEASCSPVARVDRQTERCQHLLLWSLAALSQRLRQPSSQHLARRAP